MCVVPISSFLFVCHFRRLPLLEATAAEISSQTGNPVVAVQLDIRDPSGVSAALDVCEAKFGLPNIIINNAAGNFISVSFLLYFIFLCSTPFAP